MQAARVCSNSILQAEQTDDRLRETRKSGIRKYVSCDTSLYERKFMLKATLLPERTTKRVRRQTTRFGDYVLLERLGSGGDGNVFIGRNVHTLEKVAIKMIQKNQEYKKIKRARREYNIMGQLSHKNIIKLIDVIENDKSICIVMEYAPAGDLFDYIAKCGKLEQYEALRIFRQLVAAVGYLHAQGFIHRDIKPENVFLDENLNVKLGDFGYASSWSSLKRRRRSCGSVMYASPEIISPSGSYVGPEVDCWSLGACLYTMLTNRFPFEASDMSTVRYKIITGAWKPPPSFSLILTDLLDKLLELNPLKRASIRDLSKHPWMTGVDFPLRRTRRMSEPMLEVSKFNAQRSPPKKKKANKSKPFLDVIAEE